MEDVLLPGISDRIKAAIIDSIVIIIFMIIATYALDAFKNENATFKIIAFVFIFILYDPLFTSSFGGTIGHMMIGIMVKREKDHSKNIIFPLALVRFLIKATLGWLSLLIVHANKQHLAIHDYVGKSIVLFKKK